MYPYLPPAYEVRREVIFSVIFCQFTGGRGEGYPDQDRGTPTHPTLGCARFQDFVFKLCNRRANLYPTVQNFNIVTYVFARLEQMSIFKPVARIEEKMLKTSTPLARTRTGYPHPLPHSAPPQTRTRTGCPPHPTPGQGTPCPTPTSPLCRTRCPTQS